MQLAQGDLRGGADQLPGLLAIPRPLAQADPGNAGWQRDLSVATTRSATCWWRRATCAAALTSYQRRARDQRDAGAADPGNAGWQRDLSVSHDKIGDVLVAQGDLRGGADQLPAPRSRSPRRWRRRTPATPMAARPLGQRTTRSATCCGRRATCAAALTSLPRRLAIRETLAPARPRQRRLAARPLGHAQQDRRRAGWRRATCAAALTSLPRRPRDRRDAWRRRDPGNAGWQRDLSVCYNKIGDVLLAQGDLRGRRSTSLPRRPRDRASAGAAATPATPDGSATSRSATTGSATCCWRRATARARSTSYRAGLAIAETLARRDPGNAEWQRDLIVSCVNIAEADPAAAPALLTRALDIARQLEASGKLAPVDAWMPGDLARRLAELTK